jgi:hypothetical protein
MIVPNCPNCDEPNPLHTDDFEFHETHNGTAIQTHVDCMHCNAPMRLVVKLAFDSDPVEPYRKNRVTNLLRR